MLSSLLARLAVLRRALSVALLTTAVFVLSPLVRAEAWAESRGIRPNASWALWAILALWAGLVAFQLATGSGCPMSSGGHSPCGGLR